ncbi:SGNH/GDSL hydrolase N-terminal domain-containing protein, partial [Paenibacillus sp. TAF58]
MPNQQQPVNAVQLDENMRIQQSVDNHVRWYSPLEKPFHIAGFAWMHGEKLYRRLPVKPEWKLPDAVDQLANCTAGGQIRFETNATFLSIKVKLKGTANMYHM